MTAGITVQRWGEGYAVFDGKDRLSGANNRAIAEAIRDRIARERSPQMRVRPCLCCGKDFTSEGPHNRMCGTCRLQPSDIFYQVAGRSAHRGRRPARS